MHSFFIWSINNFSLGTFICKYQILPLNTRRLVYEATDPTSVTQPQIDKCHVQTKSIF